MSRKSGYRFSEKDMRQCKENSHFRGRYQMNSILFDRKWL